MIIQDNSCYERYTIEILNSGDTATAGAAQSIWSIENVGSGVGVFSGATNHTAKFKSLVAGNNINITSTGNTIVISSSGGTSTNITANNGINRIGDNVGLGGTLTGNTSIVGSSNSLSILPNSLLLQSIGSNVTYGLNLNSTNGGIIIQKNGGNGGEIRIQSDTGITYQVSNNGRIKVQHGNGLASNFAGIEYTHNYASKFNPRSLVDKGYVTGFTSYVITNSSSIVIGNQYKNTTIYCTNTGTTNIYIPDTVDSGMTFTSVRTAGLVNHIATGTSSLNSIGNATGIQIENGASTWQYVGNSNWYGFGALGSPITDGSSSISASNGLTKVGNNITLGGMLTGHTTIDANSKQIVIHSYDIFDVGSTGLVNIAGGQDQANYINIISSGTSLNLGGVDAVIMGTSNGVGSSFVFAPATQLSAYTSFEIDTPTVEVNVDTDFIIYNTSTNNFLSQSGAGTSINLDEENGGTFSVNNSGTILAIGQDNKVQLNLSGDTTNDIYTRNSSGYIQRIAAGTGSTVLMMNTGGTGHIYSKITSNNIAANAVTTTAINNSAVTIAKLANSAGGTRLIGRSANSAGAYGEIAATADGQSLRRVGGVLGFGNCSTVSYTVATLPSAATAGQMIYVSDESGGAVIAFSDGTNWRRVTDRNIVS